MPLGTKAKHFQSLVTASVSPNDLGEALCSSQANVIPAQIEHSQGSVVTDTCGRGARIGEESMIETKERAREDGGIKNGARVT